MYKNSCSSSEVIGSWIRTLDFLSVFPGVGISSIAGAEGCGRLGSGLAFKGFFVIIFLTDGLGLANSFRNVNFLVEGVRLLWKHVNRTTKRILCINETRKNTMS